MNYTKWIMVEFLVHISWAQQFDCLCCLTQVRNVQATFNWVHLVRKYVHPNSIKVQKHPRTKCVPFLYKESKHDGRIEKPLTSWLKMFERNLGPLSISANHNKLYNLSTIFNLDISFSKTWLAWEEGWPQISTHQSTEIFTTNPFKSTTTSARCNEAWQVPRLNLTLIISAVRGLVFVGVWWWKNNKDISDI